MIADKTDLLKNYGFKWLCEAVEFINSCTADTADGKYELEKLPGAFAVVSQYDTKDIEKGLWECHRKYIDIQAVVCGVENLNWAPLSSLEEKIPYDESKDCAQPVGESMLTQTLRPGYAAVLFPQDAHMPMMNFNGTEHVKKIVIKIPVEYIA